MYLKRLELAGFKSFAKKSELDFTAPVTAIVGPNGSGKSNVAEAFRFVLGEQSMKSLRTKRGEDLIFNGSPSVARLNRALVTVVFNNESHIFPIDFSEVSLTREVYRDGTNRYLINDSQVRLKDVLELLASARIGSSQHHIISQGEADRVLRANPLERRSMIEDALGLRIYQFKKAESQRKLKKTEENLVQIRTLEKEIEPHLKFLEKQVKRIEEARELREELITSAQEYFLREERYLEKHKNLFEKEKNDLHKEIDNLDREISDLKTSIEEGKEGEHEGKVLQLEEKMRSLRQKKEETSRKIGQLEGQILYEKRLEEQSRREEGQEGGSAIPYQKVSEFWKNSEAKIIEFFKESDLEKMKDGVRKVLVEFREFLETHKKKMTSYDKETLSRLLHEQEELQHELEKLEGQEEEQRKESENLKAEMDKERGRFRNVERDIFDKMTTQTELSVQLEKRDNALSEMSRERNIFESDLSEFVMLVSREVLKYRDFSLDEEEEDREIQRKRRQTLERKKIKVEEMGGSGEEIMTEYQSLKERKEFFTREIEDLERTKSSLETLIDDLDAQLDTEFKDGLKAINHEFQEFFSVIFGGGKASLDLSRKARKVAQEEGEGVEITEPSQEEELKEGLEISIALPKKRIKGIDMLSGGERSLTSVALLFAISQVNPPPFLVLDETDAALDESNSRRYGEMLETLSRKTQLIIITHNRETMAKAGILYGITVGLDGVSKVLSVKFEEASAAAAR